jgi:hypothetical protein
MKGSVLAAALLVSLGATASWAAPVLVSGDTVIGILDTDMDGMPDPPQDCSFMGDLTGNTLTIDSTLGTGVALQGCTGDYVATTSANGTIDVNFTAAPGVVGTVELPTLASFSHANGTGSGAGNGNGTFLDQAFIQFQNGLPSEDTATAFLCSNGGPAVIIRTTGGTTVLFALQFFPDANEPEYLKLPNIPISNSVGEKVFIDGYIPVTSDGRLTVMVGAETFVDIPLTELQACGTPAVPTMSELGLIALALALLAGGVWVLRKRPAFARSLSML